MIHFVRMAASFACLGALATAAQAQQSGPDIVVTDQRPMTGDETLEAVRRVARPVDGQLARFIDRVCPVVIGFQDQYEAMVANRIREIAATAGAPVGGDDCAPNLYVMIVDDGREFVRELEREYPEAFEGLSRREYEQLVRSEGAARSWSATMLTNSAGQGAGTTTTNSGSRGVTTGYQGSSVSFGSNNVMRVYESSNAGPSVQQTIAASWVVLETGATFGKSLTQIADYAALRGLAMVRPSELDGSEDTILDLFEPGSEGAAPGLTDFDLAYLKGLYSVQGRRWARQQVRQVADVIASETAQARP